MDALTTYEHLSSFAPDLAKARTPDWLVYLATHHAGRFAGIVTRDLSQVDQDEEIVAVDRTTLSVVTWRKAIEDPIVEWGQLLAYMPAIRQHIEQNGPAIFILPAPRLVPDNIKSATVRAHELAAARAVSYPELRNQALATMRRELQRRNLGHLADYLG